MLPLASPAFSVDSLAVTSLIDLVVEQDSQLESSLLQAGWLVKWLLSVDLHF